MTAFKREFFDGEVVVVREEDGSVATHSHGSRYFRLDGLHVAMFGLIQDLSQDSSQSELDATCPQQGKFIGGCKFQARYHSRFPEGIKSMEGGQSEIQAIMTKTYLGEACIRCGKFRPVTEGSR
ncbi:hypothetical protein [Rhizobium sp. SSA_523]|uniref:hypothetical protein n=1 Tax=Rhizobium sp. SSA_523 TaxID=2952477 RepID=UPI002090DC7F|nr:hypothetical protein [Rhizobium sp. SSA_523]WKC25213.1 hypothetical protein QTJ18_14600 [Rhizobium sp. SSA_523]